MVTMYSSLFCFLVGTLLCCPCSSFQHLSTYTPASCRQQQLLSNVPRIYASSSSSSSSTTTISSLSATSTTSSSYSVSSIEQNVSTLKRVLEREYLSFFDPMEQDYYAPDVTFDDPLTALQGVASYQTNVDMLAGRTFMGSILFRDASITLHSITGGKVVEDPDATTITIAPLITRWTLRFTFQALPWAPTPRFSGISRYTVVPGGPKGVQIVQQEDFWDSINLVDKASYQKVPKSQALQHFFQQVAPTNWFQAPSAGPEIPYQTLRIGNGYEVRRYPSYTAARMEYERKDEAFSAMGAFTSGLNPLAPALFEVSTTTVNKQKRKTMQWPLAFAPPGETTPPPTNPLAVQRANSSKGEVEIVTVPESVVAIVRFGDAIVEPVVRRVDQELRTALERDGLVATSNESLMFAQYDAIFSMGKRRSEVYVPLSEHPW